MIILYLQNKNQLSFTIFSFYLDILSVISLVSYILNSIRIIAEKVNGVIHFF